MVTPRKSTNGLNKWSKMNEISINDINGYHMF